MTLIERHRTAKARIELSRPVALALGDGVLRPGDSVFDYGCGRGGDVERLNTLGYDAAGWDPAYAPGEPLREADVVNLGYVLNVIEDVAERREALEKAWRLAGRALIVAARPAWEGKGLTGRPHLDGWLTATGTFQRFFEQEELRSLIDAVLGGHAVAAGPGIFYVFRDQRETMGFRARQVRRTGTPRRRLSETLFEDHREVLDALVTFVEERGRLPAAPAELEEGEALVAAFGSIKAAFAVLRRVTTPDRWEDARTRAAENLLVYLALAAFGGRPRMSELPEDLQHDVRTFFGSYKAACAGADQLLFAAGRSQDLAGAVGKMTVGKVLPDAAYVHISALALLPALLRVYEGCAQVLVGAVPEATIVKLHRIERKVAYLSYPEFDRAPHPPLATSLRADLRTLDVRLRDFRDSTNPPILHRKETFVPTDYPGREKFARLSRAEERAGLLGQPAIGTRHGWEEVLDVNGLALRGHRLIKRTRPHH